MKLRLTTDEGYQIVKVESRYAYAWSGRPPLKLGERVIVPGIGAGSHWTGAVTDFGTEFSGPLKMIIERVVPVPMPMISSKVGDKMRKDYEDGLSIREVAEKHGHSYAGSRLALLRSGTTLRKRGGYYK